MKRCGGVGKLGSHGGRAEEREADMKENRREGKAVEKGTSRGGSVNSENWVESGVVRRKRVGGEIGTDDCVRTRRVEAAKEKGDRAFGLFKKEE